MLKTNTVSVVRAKLKIDAAIFFQKQNIDAKVLIKLASMIAQALSTRKRIFSSTFNLAEKRRWSSVLGNKKASLSEYILVIATPSGREVLSAQ